MIASLGLSSRIFVIAREDSRGEHDRLDKHRRSDSVYHVVISTTSTRSLSIGRTQRRPLAVTASVLTSVIVVGLVVNKMSEALFSSDVNIGVFLRNDIQPLMRRYAEEIAEADAESNDIKETARKRQ